MLLPSERSLLFNCTLNQQPFSDLFISSGLCKIVHDNLRILIDKEQFYILLRMVGLTAEQGSDACFFFHKSTKLVCIYSTVWVATV
jgi:hypothetical protein